MDELSVLVVSPHFPPTNAADMQRVRMLLPHFQAAGIHAECLAVAADDVAAPRDEWLLGSIPETVPVHRANAWGLWLRRIPGLGTLSYRALGPLRKAGNRALAEQVGKGRSDSKGSGRTRTRFDLVYFSTTQFGILTLGPYWERKFGIPFVIDYQDPWVNDYYAQNPSVPPPGGRIKYAIARSISCFNEPRVISRCSGITSVSSSYPAQLKERYDFLPSDFPTLVAPFPGDEADLKRVKDDRSLSQQVFPTDSRQSNWVYVGRGGLDMHAALKGLFAAIKRRSTAHPEWLDQIRLHFIGTSYAERGHGIETVRPLAEQYGIGRVVNEVTHRIPYSNALRCLLDADALIVPGSDDPAYTASKIYPYLLARKPMLAIFHQSSSVVELIRSVGGAKLATFDTAQPKEALMNQIESSWLADDRWKQPVALDEEAFRPYTADFQAKDLQRFFRRVLGEAELKV